MVNYQEGKIYKIVSDSTEKIYIGSTCKNLLSQRMASHKSDFKKVNEKKMICSSFKILEYGDAQIFLIENFPCNSKNELLARERYWIEQNKEIAVNIQIPTRNQKEYQTEYYETNKEQLIENCKKYRKENIEKVKEYDKVRGKLRTQCECGKMVDRHKAQHQKTKFHKEWLEKQQQN